MDEELERKSGLNPLPMGGVLAHTHPITILS